eukprot:UN06628
MFGGDHCITPKTALGMTVATGTNINDNVQVEVTELTENNINALIVDEKMEDNNEKIVENEGNQNDKSEQWQAVVKNGKQREIKRNKDLSVIGVANNKYSDKTFEFEGNDDGVSYWKKMPNTSIILICSMVFASIGLFVMYRKKQTGYRYSKVQLDDNELVNNGTLLVNH